MEGRRRSWQFSAPILAQIFCRKLEQLRNRFDGPIGEADIDVTEVGGKAAQSGNIRGAVASANAGTILVIVPVDIRFREIDFPRDFNMTKSFAQ
jgi:hypothetical protein